MTSLTSVERGPGAPRFYGGDFVMPGANLTRAAEARRLQTMARVADAVSIRQIAQGLAINGNVDNNKLVVDVGCGDSTSLGERLIGDGVMYLPVDFRPDAVSAQRERGFPAIQSDATELDIKPSVADIVHARFAFGWLSESSRSPALAEAIRVGKDIFTLSVIDYDWSVVDGPKHFKQVLGRVVEIMRIFEFEPFYGRYLKDDIRKQLPLYVDMKNELGRVVVSEESRKSVYSGTMQGSLAFVEQTADVIIGRLREHGMQSAAEEVLAGLDKLRLQSASNPNEQVKLPDIVGVNVNFTNTSMLLTERAREHNAAHNRRRLAAQAMAAETFVVGRDFEATNVGIPYLENVVTAKGPRLTLVARQVQASAYLKDGVVNERAIGPDEALTVAVDPVELVDRSVYYIMLDKATRSVVRRIDPNEHGVRSLPTIERIFKHAPETARLLKEHPIMTSKVFEVSSFSKSMLHGSFWDVVAAVIALGAEAFNEGYDFAVMGLQAKHLPLIEGVFGTDAIRRIEGDDANHGIALDGVNESVTFVPLMVNIKTFISDLHAHAKAQLLATEQNSRGSLFRRIVDATDAILAQRG